MKRRTFLKAASGLLVPWYAYGQLGKSLPFLARDISSSSCSNATADTWAAQVVSNGGSAPSAQQKAGVCYFCNALEAATLDSDMINIIINMPGNKIASLTPIYNTLPVTTPWATIGTWTDGNFGVNGWTAQAPNSVFSTGLKPNQLSSTSHGFTMYCYDPVSSSNTMTDLGSFDDNINYESCYINLGNSTSWNDYYGGSSDGQISGTAPNVGGYYSFNRTASNAFAIYFANSTNPHAAIATKATAGGSANNVVMYHMTLNDLGFNSGGIDRARIYSIVGAHTGLSSSQSAAFYAICQAALPLIGVGVV